MATSKIPFAINYIALVPTAVALYCFYSKPRSAAGKFWAFIGIVPEVAITGVHGYFIHSSPGGNFNLGFFLPIACMAILLLFIILKGSFKRKESEEGEDEDEESESESESEAKVDKKTVGDVLGTKKGPGTTLDDKDKYALQVLKAFEKKIPSGALD